MSSVEAGAAILPLRLVEVGAIPLAGAAVRRLLQEAGATPLSPALATGERHNRVPRRRILCLQVCLLLNLSNMLTVHLIREYPSLDDCCQILKDV